MAITAQDTILKPGYKQTEVGVMPEDWEVKKVGEIGSKFVNGGTPSTQKPEYWSGNIPWITGADIVNQRIDVVRRYITKEAVNNSSTNIIEEGNLLLVTRTGVGKMTIAPFDGLSRAFGAADWLDIFARINRSTGRNDLVER